MKKRGISPLIATVFLVGMALLTAMIVMMGGMKSYEQSTAIAEKWIANKVLRFSAEWPPRANCTQIYNTTGAQCDGDQYYCLLIENRENEVVHYNVVTTGNLGSEVCSPDHFRLEPLESKIFAIATNSSIVGNQSLVAEVSAVQEVNIPGGGTPIPP